jgi:hypothetical protein
MRLTSSNRLGASVIRFPCATAVAVFTVLVLAPSASHAAVEVVQSDEEANQTTLVSFPTAKCVKGKGRLLTFHAKAKRAGWSLSVNIFRTRAREVDLEYGSDGNADFTVRGPQGEFTNLFRPPNAPPGGGAIAFNRKKTRMGLGFSPTFNENFSSSVSVAGGLKCKYPKKKRRRR